jgi:hypothetical protein
VPLFLSIDRRTASASSPGPDLTFGYHKLTSPQRHGEQFGRTFRNIRATFHMRSTGDPGDSTGVFSATGIDGNDALVEDEQVVLWRVQRSRQMGFRERLAERIAISRIDLHELERLISGGCPQWTAYRILRP